MTDSPQFYVEDMFSVDGYYPATHEDIQKSYVCLFTQSEPGVFTKWDGPRPGTEKKSIPADVAISMGGRGDLPVSKVADMFSDMRLAEMFAEMNRDKIRYWAEVSKFVVYDDRRWTTDTPGGVFPFIWKMIKVLYRTATECPDYAMRGAMISATSKLEQHRRQETLQSAIKVRPEMIVNASVLDQHPLLATVSNGVLDLKTGNLLSHRADYFMTRLIPIEYDPDAQCPLFLTFLDRIFAGNQAVISYLQRLSGYLLTGETGEQVLVFFYGLGCNGKSVLANILKALLGDFATTSGSDLLMARDSRGASNDVAATRGSRLVIVSEFNEGERLDEARIKTTTGGDSVSCRFLYQEFFSFIPTFKIVLIGNHKPKVRGTDHGIWRRFHLLRFNVTIPEAERDPHLQDRLLEELPGILAWAVRGCLEWQRVGLSAPEEVKAATDEYRQSEDIFSQWLDECCTRGVSMTATAADLLKSFIDHTGWKHITQTKFGRMLADAGFTKGKSTIGNALWVGLGLLATETQRHWQETDDLDRPF